MSNREAYVEKMKAKLDEWNAAIAKLEAQSKDAKADARLEYNKQIDGLRKQQKETEIYLGRLRSAGDDAWDDLKVGIDSAWDSMERALKTAISRFD